MPRVLKLVALTFSASLLAAVALAPGCGDECSRKDDCQHGEVCYKGVCTSLSADYVKCSTDDECDPNGNFECRGGRCIIKSTGPLPDAGAVFPDASFPDANSGGVDATVRPDATSTTTPDAGSFDV